MHVKQSSGTPSTISGKLKKFEAYLLKNELNAMALGLGRVAGGHNRYIFKVYSFSLYLFLTPKSL